MISETLIYSLRLSEYRRESLEMKLKKRRLNISICLCIMSLPLNHQNFLNPFLVSIFFWSRKSRCISRLSIILENSWFPDNGSHDVNTALPTLIFPWPHPSPPLLNRIIETLIIVKRHVPAFKRKPSHRLFAMSIESSSPKAYFWNSGGWLSVAGYKPYYQSWDAGTNWHSQFHVPTRHGQLDRFSFG